MPDALMDQAAKLGIQPRTSFFGDGEIRDIISRYAGSRGVYESAMALTKAQQEAEQTRGMQTENEAREFTLGRAKQAAADEDEYHLQRTELMKHLLDIDPEAPDFLQKYTAFHAALPEAAKNDESIHSISRALELRNGKWEQDRMRDADKRTAVKTEIAKIVLPFATPEQQATIQEDLANPDADHTRIIGMLPGAHAAAAAEKQQEREQRHQWKLDVLQTNYRRKVAEDDEKFIESGIKQADGLDAESLAHIKSEDGMPKLVEKYEYLKSRGKDKGLDFTDKDIAAYGDIHAFAAAATNNADPKTEPSDQQKIDTAKAIYKAFTAIRTKQYVDENRRKQKAYMDEDAATSAAQEGIVPKSSAAPASATPAAIPAGDKKDAGEWFNSWKAKQQKP